MVLVPTDGRTQVHAQWAIALQTSALDVIASRPLLQRRTMMISSQPSSGAQHVGWNKHSMFQMALSGVCKGTARAGADPQVTPMSNPGDVVIDRGADPLSAPQLLILHQVVCALVLVCM